MTNPLKLAEIIVDLPLMQTDKPFSYLIPDSLSDLIQMGMRVHVPFGKGDRLVQGLVVGFSTGTDIKNLKPIVEVLDLEPVLTEEQLRLADRMRKQVFAYKISILKAMLPNLLNSNYDKLITRPDGTRDRWSRLTDSEKLTALKEARAGHLQVTYLAQSKENRKTIPYISATAKLKDFDLGSRSKKREVFKQILLARQTPIRRSDLDVSSTIIKYFLDQGLIKIDQVEINRATANFSDIQPDQPYLLNSEQAEVLESVIRSDRPILLEGITGSGKTEVYLQVIAHFLSQGKTAIMLVPEISLTPLITNRFIARFGDQVAIMHSGLSDGEKYDEWRKIKTGQAKVVVGARSAIFAPLDKIGTIIIDEEHESSYKQDANPRYHARDIALLRAQSHQAVLVLGSATPSLESRARAQKKVYQLLRLTKRANPRAVLPKVEILDMRQHLNDQSSHFAPLLLDKMKERIARKEQIILMLNRRGYSSFVMCRDCGYTVKCPNCDVSLTLHMDSKTLNCHYCGHVARIPQVCPNCQSRKIKYYGAGTQKVQEELTRLIPEARVLRMDVDTTRTKHAHETILSQFESGQADILLGTQMIAKGLDFPQVTLVGVINADTGLNLPDFRASERTFQLLTQVAGRSGRAQKEGEVLIQTYNPNHYAILLAKGQDYEAFYRQEMNFRHALDYPPYYYLVQVLISHKDEGVAIQKSYQIVELIRAGLSEAIKILGPTPKPISRTHNLYHYQILIKYKEEQGLEKILNQVLDLAQQKENKEVRVIIDSEPQNFI